MTLLFFDVGENAGLFTSFGEAAQSLFEGFSGTHDYACHDIVFTSFRVWSEWWVFFWGAPNLSRLNSLCQCKTRLYENRPFYPNWAEIQGIRGLQGSFR